MMPMAMIPAMTIMAMMAIWFPPPTNALACSQVVFGCARCLYLVESVICGEILLGAMCGMSSEWVSTYLIFVLFSPQTQFRN